MNIEKNNKNNFNFIASIYENHEKSQYGHSISKKEFKVFSEAINFIHQNFYNYNTIGTIMFDKNNDYPGLIGSLSISYEDRDKSIEELYDSIWLYPDPNYRGKEENDYWGLIGEYNLWKEMRDSNKEEISLD